MNTELGQISAVVRPERKPLPLSRIFRGLVLTVLILSALGVIFQTAERLSHGGYLLDATLMRLTNVDSETSIPAWMSSSMMLISAGLLALIAIGVRQSGDRFYRYWGGLAAVFVYLSLDEAVSIHEAMNSKLRNVLHFSGVLHYGWIIPAAVLLIVLFLIYRPFLAHIPFELRRWLIVAGGVFVAGAMGMEMVGGLYATSNGTETLTYYLIVTVEETLEALGLVIFIYALLSHVQSRFQVDIRPHD